MKGITGRATAFRELIKERGAALRQNTYVEIERLVDSPTEEFTFQGRKAHVSVIVEHHKANQLRVVVQGFLKALIGAHVALDGFYITNEGAISEMPEDEFRGYD